MRAFLFSFIAFCSVVSQGLAQPVRTWVSGSGSDAAACDRTNPCRNFAAAITAVGAGGEVVVLDSAGYGSVTIDKSVSIIAPPGIFAAIAPTVGNAITIADSLSDAIVVLRGLTLNGRGANRGIDHTGGSGAASLNRVYIENCIVSGFQLTGINLGRDGKFFINETVVRECGLSGIYISGAPASPSHGSLSEVILERNGDGLTVANAIVAVRGSIASSNLFNGFFVSKGLADDFARLSVEDCQATQNSVGFRASPSGSEIFVTNSLAFSNGTGVLAHGGGIVRVRNTSALRNSNGFNNNASTFESGGGNNVRGNTNDVTGTITPYTSP